MTSPPEKLYLEVWPEESEHQDVIHYEQTGYGIDPDGNTSEIFVYEREGDDPASDDIERLLSENARLKEVVALCEAVAHARNVLKEDAGEDTDTLLKQFAGRETLREENDRLKRERDELTDQTNAYADLLEVAGGVGSVADVLAYVDRISEERERFAEQLLATHRWVNDEGRQYCIDCGVDLDDDDSDSLCPAVTREHTGAEISRLMEAIEVLDRVAQAAKEWLRLWRDEGEEGHPESMTDEPDWPSVEVELVSAIEAVKAHEQKLADSRSADDRASEKPALADEQSTDRALTAALQKAQLAERVTVLERQLAEAEKRLDGFGYSKYASELQRRADLVFKKHFTVDGITADEQKEVDAIEAKLDRLESELAAPGFRRLEREARVAELERALKNGVPFVEQAERMLLKAGYLDEVDVEDSHEWLKTARALVGEDKEGSTG